jgi:hypothetical protein
MSYRNFILQKKYEERNYLKKEMDPKYNVLIETLQEKASECKHDNGNNCCIDDWFYDSGTHSIHFIFSTGSNGYESSIVHSLDHLKDVVLYLESSDLIERVFVEGTNLDNIEDHYNFYIKIMLKE